MDAILDPENILLGFLTIKCHNHMTPAKIGVEGEASPCRMRPLDKFSRMIRRHRFLFVWKYMIFKTVSA